MTTLQVGGRFPHFYVLVFQGLRLQASTRNQIRCVFNSFHSGERFQKFAVAVCVFVEYVRVNESQIRNKMFADTKNPDTCGQGLMCNALDVIY